MRLTDIERAICEKEPLLPSQAIATNNSAGTSGITDTRGTSANRLQRILRGDLDNIVVMAMRKEPERGNSRRQCYFFDPGFRDGNLRAVLAHRGRTRPSRRAARRGRP